MYAYNKYLAELYFYMKEFYNFEMEFKTNLAQNYISGNIACLVDTDEIENCKNQIAILEENERSIFGGEGEAEAKLFCTQCGAPNSIGDRFCEKCGARLES